jgi:ribosomal protein S27AE
MSDVENKKIIPVELVYSWEVGRVFLRLVGKSLNREEFKKLKEKNLVYGLFGESAWDNELPEGWYISKDYEKIEEIIGYSFSDEIKKEINKIREKDKAYKMVEDVLSKLKIKCPVCGENLILTRWSDKGGALSCFKHDYVVVCNAEGKILDGGFSDEKDKEYNVPYFWERLLLTYMDVEKAKAVAMRENPTVGFCTICNEKLETPEDVIRHLKEVHKCD